MNGKEPFPEKCLTKISWPNQVTVRTQDEEASIVVECSIDGIVLTVELDEMGWTRQKAKTAFSILVEEALGASGRGKAIDRIGIVDNYELRCGSPGKVAVEALTGLRDIGDAGDFAMRASFRTPTDRGMTRGEVNDWMNTIIQVRSGKEDEASESPDLLEISIDYQIHFIPERVFATRLVEDHYEAFSTKIQKLQEGQLAGLAGVRVAQ